MHVFLDPQLNAPWEKLQVLPMNDEAEPDGINVSGKI